MRVLGRISPLSYVPGRPGHDRRYFMDGSRLRSLGWEPRVAFLDGFSGVVLWNATHQDWWDSDVVRFGQPDMAGVF